MPAKRISTLNLRVRPAIKRAVRIAAEREHRSVANMIEMLIRRHCGREGIEVDVPERAATEPKDG